MFTTSGSHMLMSHCLFLRRNGIRDEMGKGVKKYKCAPIQISPHAPKNKCCLLTSVVSQRTFIIQGTFLFHKKFFIVVGAVYLDLRKAFDTVNHEVLISYQIIIFQQK